jgi:acyl carrier protein
VAPNPTAGEIEALVLSGVRSSNLARTADAQLDVSPQGLLFGTGSPLDSLGLVSLIIDIEEALADAGFHVTLTDERAMSRSASPFRSVPALVAHIQERLASFT